MKYPLRLKRIVHNTKYLLKRLNTSNYLQLDWSPVHNNFGDILNPILINYISKRKVVNVSARYCRTEHIMAIGSILDRATQETIVWGSGFISVNSKCIEKPKRICAVRGPKSRDLLLESGIECPEVYGDPALLLPRFYQVTKTNRYKLGILPHYVDKKSSWIRNLSSDIKIIDIQNPNPLKVIDDISDCENIASSSLHGIIISDAYKIPSTWIRLSNKVEGGDFKFHDYFASIESDLIKPLIVQQGTATKDIIKLCKVHDLKIDLDALVNSFPQEYL